MEFLTIYVILDEKVVVMDTVINVTKTVAENLSQALNGRR